MRSGRSALLVAVGLSLFAATGAEEPEIFRGLIQVTQGTATGMVRFRAWVDHWSTPEERKTLFDTLRSQGQDALVSAMEGSSMGRIQFEDELARPIRLASSWQTEKGRIVRLATNRNMTHGELNSMARSTDYPFGVMEFLLPPEGPGSGTLLAAVRVQFDAEGRLEVQSLPQNTGPQKITQVEREVAKPKKEKKKKS